MTFTEWMCSLAGCSTNDNETIVIITTFFISSPKVSECILRSNAFGELVWKDILVEGIRTLLKAHAVIVLWAN